MPKITDDDDVNLDDLDTEQSDADGGADETDELDEDLPEGDVVDAAEGDESEDAEAIAARQPDTRQTDREDRARPERRATRENDRVRNLNEELRREREQRESLQRRFDEFATRQNTAQTQESQDQRNARRALLSESERATEDIREAEQRINRQLAQTTFTVQDNADKSIFEAKAVHDPLYKRWQPKVEAERTKLAGQGVNVSREAILRYMIGDAALQSRGSKSNRTAQALGRRRVERQQTRPVDTRNDATQSRRGGSRTLEDRLANIPL